MESIDRPRSFRAAAATLVAVPLLIQIAIVRSFGVNVPLWDEFFYVPFVYLVRTGKSWSRWILLQHNEHRMVAMKLVLAPLSVLTSWNVVAEMYVSVLLVAIAIGGLWRIFRESGNRGALSFVPLAFLLCGPSQYFNMLTGIQMAFYFTLLGLVWSFRLLQKNTVRAVVGASGFAALAAFSTANGFVVWPVGLGQLIAARAGRKLIAIWTSAGLICGYLYFRDYQSPAQIRAMGAVPVALRTRVHFLLAAIGAPLGAANVAWSTGIGAAMLLVATLWAARDLRSGEIRSPYHSAAYSLIATGILSAALLAYGRTAFGMSQAVESRYITFTELAVAGLYLLAIGRGLPKLVPLVFTVVLGIGLLASGRKGIEQARWWRSHQQKARTILLTFESQPESALGSLYFPGDLLRYARYLKKNRLSAFHDSPGPAESPR